MKTKIIAAALLACALCSMRATPASAQDVNPLPFSIYLGGGVSLPLGPDSTFADVAKPGYNILVGISQKLIPVFDGLFKIEHNVFENDFANEVDGAQWQITLIGGALRARLAGPTTRYKPFLTLGAGIGLSKRTEGRIPSGPNSGVVTEETGRSTSLYYEVGGGIETSLFANVALFVQARYVYINTDDESTTYLPLTAGIKIF